MQFTSYADFREKVRLLIEGDEIGDTFSTDTLDLLIDMAEQRVYRELMARTMYVTPAPLNATNNALALPADLLQLDTVVIDGKQVEIVDVGRVGALIDSGATASGVAYCAQVGGSLIFWPAVSNTANIYISYYGRPLDVSSGINTTVAKYPEVFLYAAVAEASPFLGEDNRAGMWEQKYQMALKSAKIQEQWATANSGYIRTRLR